MNKNELIKLKALILAGFIGTSSLSLTGCDETVVDDATEQYDVIDSTGEDVRLKKQELDVPGEDFKLIVEYSLDENTSKKWRITDNKKIYTKIYTEGLDSNTKVYIDNIHTDTTLIATKETMNGITQDTMDDRIHNSLMIGFPIDNDTYLYAINEIEGQNDSFIEGSHMGFSGYSSGNISEHRYTEEDYLKAGVYANKISSVYGLLISKNNDESYGVDVSSDMIVISSNTIKKKESNGKVKILKYNRDGSYTEEIKESR